MVRPQKHNMSHGTLPWTDFGKARQVHDDKRVSNTRQCTQQYQFRRFCKAYRKLFLDEMDGSIILTPINLSTQHRHCCFCCGVFDPGKGGPRSPVHYMNPPPPGLFLKLDYAMTRGCQRSICCTISDLFRNLSLDDIYGFMISTPIQTPPSTQHRQFSFFLLL